MTTPVLIRRIAKLEGLGVFDAFSAANDLPDFRKHNLLYGFNGSGKTTLSRVFRSLEAGAVDTALPRGGRFTIELTDGKTIKEDANLGLLKDRVLVFNTDFVDRSLRWTEGTAEPVFYIGKAQADLAKKLEAEEKTLDTLLSNIEVAQIAVAAADKNFGEHKREAARLIAESLNLGRKYNAANLASDYQNTFGPEKILSDDDHQRLKTSLGQDAPLPKLQPLSVQSPDMASFGCEALEILEQTIGSIAIEELKKHETMLNWVREGLAYHLQHHLDSCLFCGNKLGADRLQALQTSLDDQFDKHIKRIGSAIETSEDIIRRLNEIKAIIPSKNDLAREIQDKFSDAAANLRQIIEQGLSLASAAQTALKLKSENPNAAITAQGLGTHSELVKWVAEFETSAESFDKVIRHHNRSYDEFEANKQAAAEQLKSHYLAEGQDTYIEFDRAASDAGTALQKEQAKKVTTSRQVEELKAQVRQHGPAAEKINKLVSCYLGHDALTIRAQEIGYQICRGGVVIEGNLSEGEKTAIALCYFLSTLEAENRKLKQLIVIIDDPVSSLDTRALNYVFNLVKSSLSNAAQLILLTHNLAYMNETKKWLRNASKQEPPPAKPPTASLFILDAPCDPVSKKRTSSIRPMPKFLRDYDSEYHYLFYLARQFTTGGGGYDGNFYLMPNVLRKVLEIFLSFKLPGSDGLKSKVENIANANPDIDQERLRAVDRLVQVESHADSLDDLVGFSSMTIEESRDAADSLMILMEKLDKGHFDKMCALCR